jgi:hypothetical protein
MAGARESGFTQVSRLKCSIYRLRRLPVTSPGPKGTDLAESAAVSHRN